MAAHHKCATAECKHTTRTKYRYCAECRAAGINIHNPVVPSEALSQEITEKDNERSITVKTSTEVHTLEDLIRVCEIDTAVWEVVEWKANKWEMGWVNREEKKADTAHALPLYQITARMRRRNALILTMDELRKQLVEDIRAARPYIATNPKHLVNDNDWLFEFAPFDLHMGKLTWDEETVTNYDIKIATDLFNASLDFLLARALRLTGGKFARILCVFGNDVSHIDNKKGETTAGTPLDVDTRYIKVYRRIVEIHRRAIDRLSKIAPVDVVIVPGNHDELTAFHLGELLGVCYENDSNVTVDNAAKLRKYYEFGTNLFGFTHGDAEKVSELPLLMAREQSEAWARCASREWHIGHKHISEKFEARARFEQDFTSDKGIRVRRLTSLSAHDAWHTKHAYVDRRACEAFVFHRTAGFTGHLSFNCDHFTGQPLLVGA